MNNRIFARFERGRDGIIGPTIGPYEFLQWTYSIIRDDQDKEVASRRTDEDWEGPDGEPYSDIIVFSE